jgi:hypothetical protein
MNQTKELRPDCNQKDVGKKGRKVNSPGRKPLAQRKKARLARIK